MSRLPLLFGQSLYTRQAEAQYRDFRTRVSADGVEILDEFQIRRDLIALAKIEALDKFTALYTPAARKVGKLYSLISAEGDAVVARNSVKTIRNQQGSLAQIVADMTPSTFNDKWSILPESSATTLVGNSAFAGTVGIGNTPTNWTFFQDGSGTREIQTSLQIISANRVKITAGTGNRRSFLNQAITWTNVAHTITLTVESYSGSGNSQFLNIDSRGVSANLNQFTGFNPSGSFPQTISRTFTPTAGAGDLRLGFGTNSADTLANDNDEITISGVDVKIGYASSSRIIHSGAGSSTRLADNISLTGASSLIGQTEGFLYALVNTRELGAMRSIINISNGGISHSVRISITTQNTYNFITTNVSSTVIGTANSPSGLDSIVLRYGSFGFVIYINGVNVGSTSVLISGEDKNTIDIGRRVNNTEYFNDPILLTGVGKTALTEQEAIALSSIHL